MQLKKITAIIRSSQLEEVENRMKGHVPGLTVDPVKGYGDYANLFARDWMSAHVRVEIVADERHVRAIVDAIADAVHTGASGDGIIYVVPIDQVYRIRDRHRERSASPCPRCRASVRLTRRRRRASPPAQQTG